MGQDNGMNGGVPLGVGADDGVHMWLQHETKDPLPTLMYS